MAKRNAWVDAMQRASEPSDEQDEQDAPMGSSASEPASRALVPAVEAAGDGAGDARSARPGARTWRHEMPRWLATLDSGRTRHEYEKAVGYFFEAPGVPQELGAITLDLLLAYRGSLALRADRQARRASHAGASPAGAAQLPADGARGLLDGTADDGDASDEPAAPRGAELNSPLAPATVNVRLTALRQFLMHCSLWERVPQLPPERMRAALRRLKVERRRPYQVLEEQEWADFLRAASGKPDAWAKPSTPAKGEARALQSDDSSADAATPAPRSGTATPRAGPWGTTRAARARLVAAPTATGEPSPVEASGVPKGLADHNVEVVSTPQLVRSRAGLTGARTAQRDHALLALALATGLRAIEIRALDIGDIVRERHANQDEWWLILPDAKTKGQRGGRSLPLDATLMDTLFAYVQSTGRRWEAATDRHTPLFLPAAAQRPTSMATSDQHASLRRLSTAQIRFIVDRVEAQWTEGNHQNESTRSLGGSDRRISPHALRHSTAVALLEGNITSGRAPASVEHVRGWLGHVDIRTTQSYLAHLDARRYRRPFTLGPESPVEGSQSTQQPGTAPEPREK